MHRLGGSFSPSVLVERVVTRTIALVCILIVYDGWAKLKYLDVVGIVVGPIVAIFVTHVFAAGLAQHIALQRRLTGDESLAIVRTHAPYLLLAVPPLALMGLFALAGVPISSAIRAVIWIEALSIGFWAGLAARRAGLRGVSLVVAVLAGLIVSVIVLGLQVFLQPDKAVDGGVAVRPAHIEPGRPA